MVGKQSVFRVHTDWIERVQTVYVKHNNSSLSAVFAQD